MRIPAEHFLKLRALGAPAVVLSLAIQGILRGFKDTRTPVLCLGKIVHVDKTIVIAIFISLHRSILEVSLDTRSSPCYVLL